jgi:outer membrane protein TolC
VLPCSSWPAANRLGPNYNRPGYDAPAVYKETGASAVVPPPNPIRMAAGSQADPSDGMLKGKWWEIYQDPQLNQLEERIATTNVQLKQALETYLAARDQVARRAPTSFRSSRRALRPKREKYSSNQPLLENGEPNHLLRLDHSGRPVGSRIFWGRVRRTVEQARANAQASLRIWRA